MLDWRLAVAIRPFSAFQAPPCFCRTGAGGRSRHTLYFLIRYPELLRSHYSEADVAMLVGWHQAEPVSAYERHRNSAIVERQGNRNPVIDHPEWTPKIAFDTGL